ncbi:winged helix-turn-helix transcriptional regulator [Halegenticoccus soli]|uniref:winged helix-turn-helix transcriptional regulator n=1 Tax=Halegenticoccus soli TaxID=1985678 RepID=UPI000C6E24A7|nr:helix-turn-helix domain-containing protein [Halegenticoccus soli]
MKRRDDYIFTPESGEHWEVVRLTGKKWNRLILEHLLLDGPLRYNEFKRRIDDISDKVLSQSLQDLEAVHLVRREVKDTRPVEVEYSLTEAGSALEPIMEAVAEWLETYREAVERERD